ncbi:glycerol-3-phosphate phosphatase-like isoform X2 [Bacillus rossius redtenbacheri]|uniref:glycerol-3-phosphate phosphatase-like isoform X2 n=1 Tax=Bacillus rossius redtenbacheri TaxID=93214 RepID=UPI002FDEDF96
MQIAPATMTEHKSMKDIATMSKEEVLKFINSFDTIISDCDGVLWVFGNPIAGSPATINKLMSLGKKVLLMTNNAIISVQQYVKICRVLGMAIPEEDIFTPATAIARFLEAQDLARTGGEVFVLGSAALKAHLQQRGLRCSDTSVAVLPEELGVLTAELNKLSTDVRAVCVDTDINLSYLNLMKAARHLRDPECLFVVGATDANIPITEKDVYIGPGYFVSVLQDHTGRVPTVVGKPSRFLADSIVQERGLDPARTLFIGDSLLQDISLGRTAGFQTLLVLSGCSRLAEVQADTRPDYYISSLSALLPLLPGN